MNIAYGIKRIFARVAHVFDELHIARRQLDLDITINNAPQATNRRQQDRHKTAIRIKSACLAAHLARYRNRAQRYGFEKTTPA